MKKLIIMLFLSAQILCAQAGNTFTRRVSSSQTGNPCAFNLFVNDTTNGVLYFCKNGSLAAVNSATSITLAAGGTISSADTGTPTITFSSNLITFNVPIANSDTHNKYLDFTTGAGGAPATVANTMRWTMGTAAQVGGITVDWSCLNASITGTKVINWTTSSSLTSCTLAAPTSGLGDSGGNGIVFRSSLNTTRPSTYADVIAMFGGGTCSGYPKSDGTCSSSSASVSLDQVTALAANFTNTFGAGYAWQLHANTTAAALSAPTGMTDAIVSGGSLAAGVYKVSTTYINDAGESVNSSDISPDLTIVGASGNYTIRVTGPASSGNATGWCAFVSTVGGATTTETKQSCSNTFSGTLDVASIVAGQSKVSMSTAYSYGHSVTNLNSTNNNPDVALAVSCTGTSTGCIPLVINQQSTTAGDLLDLLGGGFKKFYVSSTGAATSNGGFTVSTAVAGFTAQANGGMFVGPQNGSSDNSTYTMTFGNPLTNITTAAKGGGNVLVLGGNATGATANAILGGKLTLEGGNITVGTGTGAIAGDVVTQPGACTAVTSASACNGINKQLHAFFTTGTATQHSLACVTADYTVATCTSAANGANAIGWIDSVSSNTVFVQGPIQVVTGLALSAAFTAGQYACADTATTAGDMVPSASKCAAGIFGGVVLHTATTTNPIFIVTVN